MAFALVSMLITIAVAALVGFRLVLLSRRTREFPELWAGAGLLSFALAQVCTLVMVGTHGSLPPGLNVLLRVVTLLCFTTVSIGLAAFTVYTFGPNAWRWTLASFAVLSGIVVRCMMYIQDTGVVGQDAGSSPLRSLVAATVAFIFIWMGIEGVSYYRKADRARALGLASSAVVNRFLIFGVGGLISGLMTTLGSIFALSDSMSVFVIPMILATGLVNSVVWTLSFTPPAAYQRFVEARSTAHEASHG